MIQTERDYVKALEYVIEVSSLIVLHVALQEFW